MELNEAIKFTEIISKIKSIPKDIIDHFKSKPEDLNSIEQYLLLMVNPEHTYVPPEAKESKKIFDDFLKGIHISDNDKRKFISNFKKFAKESGKVTFGFAMGLFPLFSLFMTLFETYYIYWALSHNEKVSAGWSDLKKEILKKIEEENPELWKIILQYRKTKRWNKADDPVWKYTDEPSTSDTIEPKIESFKFEILSYDEFKNTKLNESFVLAAAMGIPTLIGFGAGILVRLYIDNLKHKKRIEYLYQEAKKNNKSKEELIRIRKKLNLIKGKDSKNLIKIKNKQQEIKDKQFKLSDLPKEQQEKAKKEAAKYQIELEKLGRKEINILGKKNLID